MLWPRIYEASQECFVNSAPQISTIVSFTLRSAKSQNPTKKSKMLENKLYLDIKSTANRFHWIANYSISSTESKLEAPYKDSINHSETKWGTPVQWGWFLLFSRSGGHKTKETYPTRPGSPTPCKQGLKGLKTTGDCKGTINKMRLIVATLNPASGVQLKSDAHTCIQRSFSRKTLRPACPATLLK